MSGAELAALITACGTSIAAILAALAALRSARYSKERVVILEEQIKELRAENVLLKQHNVDQDAILVDREQQIAKLRAENEALNRKINKWHEWGFNMGRILNQMQLQIGFMRRQPMGETAPLPPNEDEPQVEG